MMINLMLGDCLERMKEIPDGSVVGKSSTGLSKAEFSDFCTKVEAFAVQELGVIFYDERAEAVV